MSETESLNISANPQLSSLQHEAINLLAFGASRTQTAEQLGIHRNTIARWYRTDPHFAYELESAGAESARHFRDQALELVPQALQVLKDILANEKASPSVKFRAASKILDLALTPNPQPMKSAPPAPAPPMAQADVDRQNKMLAMAEKLHHSAQIVSQRNAEALEKLKEWDGDQPENVQQPAQIAQTVRKAPEPARNSPCPCKSGLKYKRCCWLKKTYPDAA